MARPCLPRHDLQQQRLRRNREQPADDWPGAADRRDDHNPEQRGAHRRARRSASGGGHRAVAAGGGARLCGGLAAHQARQLARDTTHARLCANILFLSIFAFYRPAASIAATLALGFLAVWMGAATAHKTTGWRTLLLPVVVALVYVLGSAVINILLAGAQFTFQALLADFGLQ